MNHRKLEFSPYLQQTHFVMWHKEQLLNLSDKSEIRKKNHPPKKKKPQNHDAAAIRFPVDAALFYLAHCFRASDNTAKP